MLVYKHSYKDNNYNKILNQGPLLRKETNKNNSKQDLRETRETKVRYFTKR